jgi:hypothetical protein
MSSITAVELGADICALAKTSVRRGEIRLLAAEALDPAQFPGPEALTAAVRQSRRALRLPRRCRVVVWGLAEGASRHDPFVTSILRPLVGAGLEIERVVTPCNALAALARLKTARGDGATCWLAINRGGVAIVVVRPGEQLYAHSFVWNSSVGSIGSQARLLQRYSLVSVLAPEVRRAMAAAIDKGTRVEAIVTCGNLPDLRSLTMPLIEELDVEVETLDSLEGLEVAPDLADRLADTAPLIRLACAGTIARSTRARDAAKRRRHLVGRWLRVAAVIAGICAVGYAWYVKRTSPQLPAPRTVVAPPAPKIESRDPKAGQPQNAPATSPVEPRKQTTQSKVESREPKTEKPQDAPRPSPLDSRTSVPAPRSSIPAPRTQALEPRTPQTTVQPLVTAPAPNVAPPAASAPASSAPGAAPTSNTSMPPANATIPPIAPGLRTPSVPADKVNTRPPRPIPALLKDPLPRVTGILVGSDRRYATVEGGRIVRVGDTLGRRTVVAIDDRTVLLREPSGVQIRVGLGGRVIGVERSDR